MGNKPQVSSAIIIQSSANILEWPSVPGFWILPTFQGHIGQSSKLHRRVARFVAVWPRELKFGVMMYLGSHYVYAKFRPDRTPNLAARGH
jgi:hypothetical protein